MAPYLVKSIRAWVCRFLSYLINYSSLGRQWPSRKNLRSVPPSRSFFLILHSFSPFSLFISVLTVKNVVFQACLNTWNWPIELSGEGWWIWIFLKFKMDLWIYSMNSMEYMLKVSLTLFSTSFNLSVIGWGIVFRCNSERYFPSPRSSRISAPMTDNLSTTSQQLEKCSQKVTPVISR